MNGLCPLPVVSAIVGGVDAGGFGEGFPEGVVALMVVEYRENILVSMASIRAVQRVALLECPCLRRGESVSLEVMPSPGTLSG